ncbi:MAG: HAMP domain-containing histidine kinase [Actinobacteria bacterium]|nr:HAMP domain-containing histidine kinase [Actinomycetota bacterium]
MPTTPLRRRRHLRGTSTARPYRRLGLRARFTIAFGLGSFVISVLLSLVAYGLVRTNLVSQRERSAIGQAYLNASALRNGLRSADANAKDLLDSLQTPGGGRPLLYYKGEWFALEITHGRDSLPVELRNTVLGGTPARMRYSLDNETSLAVGVPIPLIDAAYFESSSFSELQSTLNALAISLTITAIVTTLAGALLGTTASRRVLRPLAEISTAAQAISGGRLDTRVALVSDPDLAGFVNSFNDMARFLQERFERDARFASDISHELRSPLTTLSASVEVLQSRREELTERGQAVLDLLAADVTRFTMMVEDLLEISRFDAGAARLDLTEVRIGELVVHAVSAASSGTTPVSVESNAAGAIVQVDKRRLMQVMANLIQNAAHYGGGATEVSVELADDQVRICVQDEGGGVPAIDRERIFERFARGSVASGRRGAGEGTGLGLALVREHVNLHGGRVWVEDRLDGLPGARFVVELPIVTPQAEPEEDLGPAAVPAVEVES